MFALLNVREGSIEYNNIIIVRKKCVGHDALIYAAYRVCYFERCRSAMNDIYDELLN